MAHVIDRREPVIVKDRDPEYIRTVDDNRSNTGVIIALVVLGLLLLLIFGGSRLFSGGNSGGTNINVPSPSTTNGVGQ